jgi:ferredoxin-thioredoxin reductase catalytic subunit
MRSPKLNWWSWSHSLLRPLANRTMHHLAPRSAQYQTLQPRSAQCHQATQAPARVQAMPCHCNQRQPLLGELKACYGTLISVGS